MLNKLTDKHLFALWGGLYILCAGLGFIPEPGDLASVALLLLSVLFFVPGFVLLYRGRRKEVGIISAVSLGLTLGALLLNVWSVVMTAFEGQVVYVVLGLVSAPMCCGRLWLLSLFLWALLLSAAVFGKKRVS